jgi:hypothetical protein
MMSPARSMKRERFFATSLAWPVPLAWQPSGASPQHGHPRHGLRVHWQVRPWRTAGARRSGLRQLRRRRAARGAAGTACSFDEGVERRRTGVSQHQHQHRKGRTGDAAAAVRCRKAPFHSEPRLEAALRPPYGTWAPHPRVPRGPLAGAALLLALEPETPGPFVVCGGAPSRRDPRRTWALPYRAQMEGRFSFWRSTSGPPPPGPGTPEPIVCPGRLGLGLSLEVPSGK